MMGVHWFWHDSPSLQHKQPPKKRWRENIHSLLAAQSYKYSRYKIYCIVLLCLNYNSNPGRVYRISYSVCNLTRQPLLDLQSSTKHVDYSENTSLSHDYMKGMEIETTLFSLSCFTIACRQNFSVNMGFSERFITSWLLHSPNPARLILRFEGNRLLAKEHRNFSQRWSGGEPRKMAPRATHDFAAS